VSGADDILGSLLGGKGGGAGDLDSAFDQLQRSAATG
jgi:hypothetical protein